MTPYVRPGEYNYIDVKRNRGKRFYSIIDLETAFQVATSGVSVQYSSALTGLPVLSSTSVGVAGGGVSGLVDGCAGHVAGQPIPFGHELFLPSNLACAFAANGQGLPVLDGTGGAGVVAGAGGVAATPNLGPPFQHQLPVTSDIDLLGFSNQVIVYCTRMRRLNIS